MIYDSCSPVSTSSSGGSNAVAGAVHRRPSEDDIASDSSMQLPSRDETVDMARDGVNKPLCAVALSEADRHQEGSSYSLRCALDGPALVVRRQQLDADAMRCLRDDARAVVDEARVGSVRGALIGIDEQRAGSFARAISLHGARTSLGSCSAGWLTPLALPHAASSSPHPRDAARARAVFVMLCRFVPRLDQCAHRPICALPGTTAQSTARTRRVASS